MREADRKTVEENLRRSDRRMEREGAMRRFYLSDAAYGALRRIRLAEERGSLLSDALAEAGRLFEGAADDRSFFAAYLAGLLDLPETAFYPVHGGGRRTVYVRNHYADAAYRRLAQTLPDTTVAYAPQFRAAVEDVSAGIADFCILPYADRNGVRVQSVESLADRNELRLTSLFSVGEEERLVYGLYARGILPSAADRKVLVFRLPSPTAALLSELLRAVSVLGAALLSLETAADLDSDTAVATVAVDTAEKMRVPLLLYLALFFPEGHVTGLYPAEEYTENE